MKRLFTFGCSFTQYWRWPTWADAMGMEYDQHQNWGICGSGNSLIFYSLAECIERNNITADDDVYIMWTNTSREDRYVGDKWLALGNIYWNDGNELPREYLKKFTCERGYLIRDLATISATRHVLDHIGCNYRFMSMVPLSQTNQNSDLGENPNDTIGPDTDVRRLYQSTLDMILPSVYETVFNSNWESRPGLPDSYDPKRRDFHPTPTEHVMYLEQVLPDVHLSNNTKNWMYQATELAEHNQLNWQEPNLPQERF